SDDGRYTIRVVKRQRTKPMPEGARYVGRPTALGSRFKPKDRSDEERANIIAAFTEEFSDEGSWPPKRVDRVAELLTELRENGELTMACWCAPKACHADVISEYLLTRA
ncbi:DUF4326 domain-containing protein, partial [Candidatus Poribacteria bacterium]|nr:DUF4326 domain-containing protein [Candidatus Poribacteria bacterium]